MTAFRDRSRPFWSCFGLMALSAFYSFRKINGAGIKFAVMYKASECRLADRKRILIRMNDVINRLTLHYKRRDEIIDQLKLLSRKIKAIA